jgi:hypothetical protein
MSTTIKIATALALVTAISVPGPSFARRVDHTTTSIIGDPDANVRLDLQRDRSNNR